MEISSHVQETYHATVDIHRMCSKSYIHVPDTLSRQHKEEQILTFGEPCSRGELVFGPVSVDTNAFSRKRKRGPPSSLLLHPNDFPHVIRRTQAPATIVFGGIEYPDVRDTKTGDRMLIVSTNTTVERSGLSMPQGKVDFGIRCTRDALPLFGVWTGEEAQHGASFGAVAVAGKCMIRLRREDIEALDASYPLVPGTILKVEPGSGKIWNDITSPNASVIGKIVGSLEYIDGVPMVPVILQIKTPVIKEIIYADKFTKFLDDHSPLDGGQKWSQLNSNFEKFAQRIDESQYRIATDLAEDQIGNNTSIPDIRKQIADALFARQNDQAITAAQSLISKVNLYWNEDDVFKNLFEFPFGWTSQLTKIKIESGVGIPQDDVDLLCSIALYMSLWLKL